MVKFTLAPKVEGSHDEYMPGCILVPLDKAHRSFPKTSGDVPPQTYWRYNRDKRRVVCMVTIIDNGVNVAWDYCGACTSSIHKCRCERGFSASHGIWTVAGGRPQRNTYATPLPPRLALEGSRRTPKQTMPMPSQDEMDAEADQAVKKRLRTFITDKKPNKAKKRTFKKFRK